MEELEKEEREERYEIWGTPEEYLDIILLEKNREELLAKVFGHSVCDLAFIKMMLKRINKDLKTKGDIDYIEEYLDKLISEKKVLIDELRGRVKGRTNVNDK